MLRLPDPSAFWPTALMTESGKSQNSRFNRSFERRQTFSKAKRACGAFWDKRNREPTGRVPDRPMREAPPGHEAKRL